MNINEYAIISRADRARKNLQKPTLPSYSVPAWASDAKKYPSAVSKNCNTSKKENTHYSGSLIIGVATMHKSNTVPVTNQQHAIDIAKMRR